MSNHWLVRVVRFSRMWETVKFLDKHCLSVKLSNEQGHFLGHWNCEGDFLETVDRARKQLGQGNKIESNAENAATISGQKTTASTLVANYRLNNYGKDIN